MTNAQFRGDIKRWTAKSNNAMELYARRVTRELHNRIVFNTPVDKGQLHWNWQIGNGSINGLVEKHTGTDKSGAYAKAAVAINSIKINGQIVYITNSVEYAYRIEYAGWSHTKAPAGMMRVALAEMGSILNKAAFEVKQ